MTRRDWTEAQARAWLKASLPKGTDVGIRVISVGLESELRWEVGSNNYLFRAAPTLRAACLALVRAAKRAGVAVATVEEP